MGFVGGVESKTTQQLPPPLRPARFHRSQLPAAPSWCFTRVAGSQMAPSSMALWREAGAASQAAGCAPSTASMGRMTLTVLCPCQLHPLPRTPGVRPRQGDRVLGLACAAILEYHRVFLPTSESGVNAGSSSMSGSLHLCLEFSQVSAQLLAGRNPLLWG